MATILPISQIKLDGGTQSREALDRATVEDYKADMRNGDVFPDVIVYHDGESYWMADGFHRITAALELQQESGEPEPSIGCDIRQGTRRDAVLHSVGSNAIHGLRRSNADKRRAVTTLLNDEEWRQWSDREIARRAGVDHVTVGKIRKELTGDFHQSELRIGADGRTINTANIGRKLYTCNECGGQFETVLYDFANKRQLCPSCWDKAEQQKRDARAARIAQAESLLSPDKWYPVSHGSQSIYNDPFDKQRDGGADPRYYGAFAIQNGSIILEGIRRGGNYAKYQIVDPLPKEDHEPESDETGETPVTRYQPGMRAECRRCAWQFNIKENVYDNWRPDDKHPGCWLCPHDHRHADVLMRIVDDQPEESATTETSPQLSAAQPETEPERANEPVQPAPAIPTPVLSSDKAAYCWQCQTTHQNWEAAEPVPNVGNMARCQRCGLKLHESVLENNTTPVVGSPRSGLVDPSPIEIHRRLAQLENYRKLNHYSREAGRAVARLNYEYGLEAARIAAKGYLAVIERAEKVLQEAEEKAAKKSSKRKREAV